MTDNEFLKMKREAEAQPLSPFAQFCVEYRNRKFRTQDGRRLFKWEVYFIYGVRKPDDFVTNKIVC